MIYACAGAGTSAAVLLDQAGPTVLFRHRLIRRLGALARHLEEQQILDCSFSACPGLDPG